MRIPLPSSVRSRSDRLPRWRWSPFGAVSASVLGIAVVLAPLANHGLDRPVDGFPLSHYPMFTEARGESAEVEHLVGVTADGRELVLDYRRLGSGGMNQVRRQVRRAVREGRSSALLAVALERSIEAGDGPFVELRLVTSAYHVDDFLGGRREPLTRTVHARVDWPELSGPGGTAR